VSATAPGPNEVNAVLYALSTLAQTCAALAALVGALGLYRLQALREASAANERAIRRILVGTGGSPLNDSFDQVLRTARALPADSGLVEGLGEAIIEWDLFDSRYANALTRLVIFEVWNLLAIFAALIGFTCVSWLAAHWTLFVILLGIASLATVAVTGGALFLMARRDSTNVSKSSAAVKGA
jgi:hypothetical protein